MALVVYGDAFDPKRTFDSMNCCCAVSMIEHPLTGGIEHGNAALRSANYEARHARRKQLIV
jgi:hypothetical protein